MAGYTSRYGADHGGGYAQFAEVDLLNQGHYAFVGDVYGCRQTLDGGNRWFGSNQGFSGSFPTGRAIAISQRPTTSGLVYWGFGPNHATDGSGQFSYSTMGGYSNVTIDSANGFGNVGYGGTGAGSGPNGEAVRPAGELIVVDLQSSSQEWIYTVTATGFQRYSNAGANAAAITGPTKLLTATQMGGPSYWVSAVLLDANHIAAVRWDHSYTGAIRQSAVYMISSSAASLRVATAGQTTITPLTLPAGVGRGHVYHMKKGLDGHFYAACAYDGAFEVALSGNNLTWTDLNVTNDLIVATIDAASDRTLWIGQAAGSVGGSNYGNDSSGMVPGHAVIKGVFSGGSWTYTYSALPAKVSGRVYQPGDTTLATGDLWWLMSRNVPISGVAYDATSIRVDPFNDSKVLITGRSGQWQTRNNGANWYPAMRGLNGGESGLVHTTGARSASASNVDYGEVHTSDQWRSAVGGSTLQAGNGKGVASSGPTTFGGDDGKTYTFTPSTGAGGASLKQNGVEIGDAAFRGAAVRISGIAVASDGTVYLCGFGGVYVLDPNTSAPNQPTITSFTPTTQAVAGTVTVTGTNLTGTTNVSVNGTAASFASVTATSLVLTVPTGATTGQIAIVTPNGTAVSAANLTISGGAGGGAPTITSFTPTTAAPGDTVTVTGTNYTGATVVKVGATSAAFTVASDTSITLTVPTAAATGKITVTGLGGTVLSSGTLTVSSGIAAPTITSFTPTTQAIGSVVTITGTNLSNASSVKVNGTSSVFTVVSGTSITFTVPNGATTGRVAVTTPGGTVTSGQTLTVTAGSGGGGGGSGVAPIIRQTVSIFPTTPHTAATLTLPVWTNPTLAGSRIVVEVGITNNGVSGIGATVTGGGTFTPSTQSPVVRQALGVDQNSTRIFQRLNAAAAAARPIVTFSGLPGAGCYVYAVAHEVTGSHATLAEDTTGAAIGAGSSQTPGTALGAPTTRNAGLWLGVVTAGNKDAMTNTGTGFTERANGTSTGTASGAKVSGIVVTKPQTISGTAQVTTTIAGGFNHNYAAQLIMIPAPDTSGGGGGGTAPFVQRIDQQSPTGAATTLTLTIPTGGVAIGHTIVVAAGSNLVNVTGITDTGSNTYQNDATATASAGTAGDVYSARVTTALAAADTITITYASSVAGRSAIALDYRNFLTASWADAGVANTATSGVFTNTDSSVTASANTAQADEVVISAVVLGGSGSSSGTLTNETGYALRGNTEQASGTMRRVAVEELVETSIQQPTATFSWVTATGYSALLVAYKLLSSGGGGGGGGGGLVGMDDTNTGRGYFARSAHYYPALVAGNGRTALQNAQWIAGRCEIVASNVIESDTGTITTDRFAGLADQMRNTNSNIVLAPYGKGPQINEGTGFFPNTYYAHQTPWPTGARIATGFSPSILRAQPYSPDQPSFTDPRGFASASFRAYRAKNAQHTIDTYNTLHGAGTLNGWYYDSCGPGSYNNLIADPLNPTQTYQQAYAAAPGGGQRVYLDLVFTIIDSAISTLGAGYVVMANGLQNGTSYFNGTNRMLNHAHIGLAESWMKGNYETFANSWPAESSWQACVDMIVDANETRGRGVWVVTNIANDTAGTAPTGWVAWTTPQIDQARRYTYATYMLAKRGACWYEFVPTAPSGDYIEGDDSWYQVDLGAPLDNPPVDVNGRGAAVAFKTGAVYKRSYTFGAVFVNPTTGPVTFVLDQDYYLVAADGSRSVTLYGAQGATKTLPAHDAVIAYISNTAPTNTSAPVGTIIAPPTAVSTASVVFKVSYTDPDGDGVATAEARIGTSGAWNPMTQQAGTWTIPLTLSAGANILQSRATDDNPSPLTGSIVQRTVTYTVAAPTAPVNTTPPSIPLDLFVGIDFQVDPGVWTNTPTTYSYTIQRRPGGGGTFATIQTGADSTYTPVTGDAGYVFRAQVSASNGTPSAGSVNSNVSNPIAAAPTVTLSVTEE